MEKNHEQTIMADQAKVIEYAKSYDWDDVRFLAKELGKKDLKIEKLKNQLDDFNRNKAENRKLQKEIDELKKKFMAKDCEVSQLRVQLEEVKQNLAFMRSAVIEALGGKKFNDPYPDDIKLRDITGAISDLTSFYKDHANETKYEYEVRNPEGKTRYLGRDFEEAKKYSEQMEGEDGRPLHPPIMVYYVCPEEDEACYDNWFYIRTYDTNPDDD